LAGRRRRWRRWPAIAGASLIGTAIEFFDFYIYATAAVIVFPHIFFPQGDTRVTLRPTRSPKWPNSAEPIGRATKAMAKVASDMGISTVVIGLLPGYESIGIVAPMLLALARFGQGPIAEVAKQRGADWPGDEGDGEGGQRLQGGRGGIALRQGYPGGFAVNHGDLHRGDRPAARL
jgi:hypothetical protein